MKLNDNEIGVLKAITLNAQDAAGGDFAFSDEIPAYVPELTGNQVKGYISALQKKGYISCDSVKVDNNIVYQITLDKRALEVLIENGMMVVAEAEEFEVWHWD